MVLLVIRTSPFGCYFGGCIIWYGFWAYFSSGFLLGKEEIVEEKERYPFVSAYSNV